MCARDHFHFWRVFYVFSESIPQLKNMSCFSMIFEIPNFQNQILKPLFCYVESSCGILWENASKTLQKWKWWRAHMQYLNKIFYVYLINPKVWHCLYIFSKDWQNYNWVKILIIQLSPASGDVFEYFYKEIKYKMNQFYFFRWIG